MQHDTATIQRIALTLNSAESIHRVIESRLSIEHQKFVDADIQYTAPITDTEAWLENLWCRVLRQSRISIDDNFFELGGNSLQATQIIARIRQHYQLDLPLTLIFEQPAIREIAHSITSSSMEKETTELHTDITHGENDHTLSYAQQRLYFLHRWESESTTYNITVAFELHGKLDLVVLETCLRKIASRHDILRTLFTISDSHAKTLIVDNELTYLNIVNANNDNTHTLVEHESQHRFDLDKGPLLRVTVFQMDDTENILLINMHHIISDGWSLGVFFRELSRLYNAALSGIPDLLPHLEIQYSDYARWQAKLLGKHQYAEQMRYWKSVLSGELPLLSLPTDRPRPSTRNSLGNVCRFHIDAVLRNRLEDLCRELGVTLYMCLLSTFFVLLQRYSHQDDIIIGTPIANRTHPASEALIGFFVNSLALRADLSGDPDFIEFLKQVKTLTLNAYANQEIPFEQLVSELNLERDLSRTPVFQHMFVFQNAQSDTLKLSGTSITPYPIHTDTSKFDLTLEVTETENGLSLVWEYDTTLFDAQTIVQMHDSYQYLLTSLRQQYTRPISKLPIIDVRQRLALVQTYEHTTKTHNKHLVDLFEDSVDRYPDKPAVDFDGFTVSYRELNQRANQLARYLLDNGVQQESLVGLCVNRSADIVVGILGILKAGAAYVPLDPEYPRERILYMLDDAGIQTVVTQSAYRDHFTDNMQLVQLDTDQNNIQKKATGNLEINFSAQQLAYIIYTSGSTGRPKGVTIPHCNITRLFTSTDHWYEFNEHDVWTLFHSYAFDFTVWELWGALLNGGRLVVVPFDVTRSPDLFHQLLVEEQVTVLNQTPTAFNQLMRVDSHSNVDPGKMALRYVIFGGEALDVKSLRPWFERHGDLRPQLINMYGITETTVHVTYRALCRDDLDTATNSAIGIPIPDLRCLVLDVHGQLLPPGVAGELHVGGAGLARGYLKRAALTAQRFIPDPFSTKPGERLYRTGDLVRLLRDGSIDYMGRIDHQVQLRGFRIELGEVEAALLIINHVQEVCALIRDESDGNPQLVAYVVAAKKLPVVKLRNELQKTLPVYMIPAAFLFMDEFPLTPNGKLDRERLPAPSHTRLDNENDIVLPRSSTEIKLAEVWQHVLQIERIGIHDSFFALGGDSIKSIPLLAHMRDEGLHLSLLQLFQEQTIERLAKIIDVGESSPRVEQQDISADLLSPEDRKALPADIEDAYPLSTLQAGILFHMQLSTQSRIYHDVNSTKLEVDFDLEAFTQAVETVIARHPIFRTSLSLIEYSTPLQLVHNSAEANITYNDIRHMNEAEQESSIDSWLQKEKNNLFDTGKAPMMRFGIHQLSNTVIQFTDSLNHVMFDGWSEISTHAEVWDLHFKYKSGDSIITEKLPGTYRDFVALEQNILLDTAYRDFWRKKLAKFEPVPLPRWPGNYRSDQLTPVCSKPLHINSKLFHRLTHLSSELRVPLKAVLLAAHYKILSTLLGLKHVTSGVVTHGRPDIEGGEKIRGLFLNTIPMMMNLEGHTWNSLICSVHTEEQSLFAYRQYPMAQIKKDIGHDFLFEAAFAYVHFHVMEEFYRTGKLRRLGETWRWAPTDIPLMCVFIHDPVDDRLAITLDYDSAVLNAQQVDSIGKYYFHTLTTITENPTDQCATKGLLPMGETQRLLFTQQSTIVPYPDQTTVHRLFDQQAHQDGNAIALIENDNQLSYAELQSRSNQLAHYLIDTGVRRGDRVGLCLQRSIDCITAILAILKAGGCYVPLDPDYPEERIAYMVADTGAQFIITNQTWVHKLPETQANVLNLDSLSDDIKQCKNSSPDIESTSSELAYVMYTSGSTGTPKGIAVPHKAIARLVINTNYIELDKNETLLLLAPISFDASTLEIWGSLLTGARLAILETTLPTLEDISRAIVQYQVTTLWLTAGLFNQIVDENIESLSPLRQLLSGGDVLSVPHIKKVLDTFPAIKLINGYGPTEGTTFTCCHHITHDNALSSSIPIGIPINNTQVYILDADKNFVPVGVSGELHIGGDGLADGYIDKPALTAECFIPDSVSGKSGARLYCTGDLVRMLPNGNIEFVGRVDQQVKIRGFRIEPGEIENKLLEHPSVREAVVLVRSDMPGTKRLVAYIVAITSIDRLALKQHLEESLPGFMIPYAFVEINEIPLTPNSKVDRSALPPPDPSTDTASKYYVAPGNDIEITLAQIWGEVLKVDKPGIFDNFFDSGGESLAATRMISRIQKATGVSLHIQALFDNPTIKGIADSLVNNKIQLQPPGNENNDREEFDI